MQVRTRHVILAVLLHVIVLGMLLIGFRCTRKVEPPPVMQATIVDAKPQKAAPPPSKEEEPKVDEEKKRLEEEKARELEEQKKKEEERDQQRKVEEQQRVEQARKQAVEEARRKKEDDARKAKEEKARREEEKRKQQQKELEDQLREQIQSEETDRTKRATASAQQAWIAQITDKVQRNWLRPPNTDENFQCRVGVTLLPTGDVTSVKLMSSCGNPVLDDSVQRAVYKSSPLPTPEDASSFDRDLIFTFKPH